MIKRFLDYKANQGQSKYTILNYGCDLDLFTEWLLSKEHGKIDDLILKITQNDLDDLISWLRKRVTKRKTTLGDNSIIRIQCCLKSFYGYLWEKQFMANNPTYKWKLLKLKKRVPKALNIEEVEQLLSSITEGVHAVRDRTIIKLFLMSGLRLSELTNIKIHDIRENKLRVIGKEDKERVIFLNKTIIDVINIYIESYRPKTDSLFLFVNDYGQKFHEHGIIYIVKKYLNKSGFDEYSTHKLRHTAATLFSEAGIDVRTIQDILGHESLESTQNYIMITDNRRKEAMDKHPLNLMEGTL